ncbi:hypothetical protein P7K49_029531 [Saguinus oedipus]|uniref:Uncharacterized protein n=1 Tax=Saguinus oedipus TaxID=9490 RepID=A0ABQ9U7G9_SAGOE|nr:hypothetical protein P7K49_029531 [Saguinus oedipus]
MFQIPFHAAASHICQQADLSPESQFSLPTVFQATHLRWLQTPETQGNPSQTLWCLCLLLPTFLLVFLAVCIPSSLWISYLISTPALLQPVSYHTQSRRKKGQVIPLQQCRNIAVNFRLSTNPPQPPSQLVSKGTSFLPSNALARLASLSAHFLNFPSSFLTISSIRTPTLSSHGLFLLHHFLVRVLPSSRPLPQLFCHCRSSTPGLPLDLKSLFSSMTPKVADAGPDGIYSRELCIALEDTRYGKSSASRRSVLTEPPTIPSQHTHTTWGNHLSLLSCQSGKKYAPTDTG